MWRVVILFDGKAKPVGPTYESRDDAWWAVSKWRQDNQCLGDSAFRVVPWSNLSVESYDLMLSEIECGNA